MTAIIIVSILLGIALIYFIVAIKRNSDHTLQYLFGIAVCIMWFGALGNVLIDDIINEYEVNPYVQSSSDINGSTYSDCNCNCGCTHCTSTYHCETNVEDAQD